MTRKARDRPDVPAQPPHPGRPPSTTHADVARIALELFAAHGFEETTVDAIAAAAGIGRRTLFRYYASKNDIVWGEFETVLAALRRRLAETPPGEPVLTSVRGAIVAANRYPPEELATLRLRLRLIGTVPALQGHSLLRYDEWRRIVSEYVAGRLGASPDDLVPSLVGNATLGTTMAAFQWWVVHGEGDPAAVVDRALAPLANGFAEAGLRPGR